MVAEILSHSSGNALTSPAKAASRLLIPRPGQCGGYDTPESACQRQFQPMSLTLDQLQRIANLARIAVGPEEVKSVTDRLNRVLALIDQLQAVDTSGIEPMAHPLDAETGVVQRRRADAVTERDRREDFQRVAPAAEGGLYLVPKVID